MGYVRLAKRLQAFLYCVALLGLSSAHASPLSLGSPLSQDGATSLKRDAPANVMALGEDLESRHLRASGYQRLRTIKPNNSLLTRGAKDVKLYAERSPSVVLVMAGDSLGTGSVVADRGDILTNWHVVANHRKVMVVFKPRIEGEAFTITDIAPATVVGIDEAKDLALLRVAAKPKTAKALPLGEESSVKVGADVHAVGHPSANYWTYTKGIVSQVRQNYPWKTENSEHQADVIQTQTPINPGNSGGPLMNEAGELIGVNSFKADGENLNFAVSVTEVKRFLADFTGPRARNLKGSELSAIAQCEPKQTGKIDNKEEEREELLLDLDCDGSPDAKLMIPEDSTNAIALVIDNNGDGEIDEVILDQDRDGKWDISYWDADGNGELDFVGKHPDGSPLASAYTAR